MLRSGLVRQLLAVANSVQLQQAACSHAFTHGSFRSLHIETKVSNNNVEAAYKQLASQCSDAGLRDELKKRDHHISNQERKFGLVRHKYNKIIGQKIKLRMKWIVKRSKLKL